MLSDLDRKELAHLSRRIISAALNVAVGDVRQDIYLVLVALSLSRLLRGLGCAAQLIYPSTRLGFRSEEVDAQPVPSKDGEGPQRQGY